MGLGAARLGVEKEEAQRRLEKQHGRRDERSAAERHCQALACQLQACASRYTYQPQRCHPLQRTYEACIAEFVAAAAREQQQQNQQQQKPQQQHAE